jgi:hypothetical protein
VFSYRVRTAKYSDNYRGTGGLSPCPLCLLHLDCQPMAFQCPVILENISVTGSYSKIFDTSVENSLARTLVKIDKFREDYLTKKKLL